MAVWLPKEASQQLATPFRLLMLPLDWQSTMVMICS